MKRFFLLGCIVAITPIMQSVSANAADLFVPRVALVTAFRRLRRLSHRAVAAAVTMAVAVTMATTAMVAGDWEACSAWY